MSGLPAVRPKRPRSLWHPPPAPLSPNMAEHCFTDTKDALSNLLGCVSCQWHRDECHALRKYWCSHCPEPNTCVFPCLQHQRSVLEVEYRYRHYAANLSHHQWRLRNLLYERHEFLKTYNPGEEESPELTDLNRNYQYEEERCSKKEEYLFNIKKKRRDVIAEDMIECPDCRDFEHQDIEQIRARTAKTRATIAQGFKSRRANVYIPSWYKPLSNAKDVQHNRQSLEDASSIESSRQSISPPRDGTAESTAAGCPSRSARRTASSQPSVSLSSSVATKRASTNRASFSRRPPEPSCESSSISVLGLLRKTSQPGRKKQSHTPSNNSIKADLEPRHIDRHIDRRIDRPIERLSKLEAAMEMRARLRAALDAD